MLEDDKSNPDEQENFSTGGSHSPVDYSIDPSHPLTIRDPDQSDSSYSDPEELEHGSSPYFLQQHGDIAVGSIKEGENNDQQGRRKRRHLAETEINRDSESDDNARPAKQRRTRSLPINNEQTSSRHNGAEDHPWPRPIVSPSSTAPSTMIDSSTSNFGGHSPAPSDGNHCYSRSPSLVKPATTTEYREWPFQGFLKRTIIGNDTTYTLEFQLQHVPEHLHLPVITEALGADTLAQTQRSCSILHSEVRPAGPKGKRVRWEADEHETIVRMKKDGCSWEEIHDALPHRTQAAIQVQYSTKLKR